METEETLRSARDLLLQMHKAMIDMEREIYEGLHGKLSPTEYLQLLMENEDFAWLRKFSTLIVEIDEMFASRSGFASDEVEAHLSSVRSLIDLEDPDEYFRAKYQYAIQKNALVANLQSEIRALMRA